MQFQILSKITMQLWYTYHTITVLQLSLRNMIRYDRYHDKLCHSVLFWNILCIMISNIFRFFTVQLWTELMIYWFNVKRFTILNLFSVQLQDLNFYRIYFSFSVFISVDGKIWISFCKVFFFLNTAWLSFLAVCFQTFIYHDAYWVS